MHEVTSPFFLRSFIVCGGGEKQRTHAPFCFLPQCSICVFLFVQHLLASLSFVLYLVCDLCRIKYACHVFLYIAVNATESAGANDLSPQRNRFFVNMIQCFFVKWVVGNFISVSTILFIILFVFFYLCVDVVE